MEYRDAQLPSKLCYLRQVVGNSYSAENLRCSRAFEMELFKS